MDGLHGLLTQKATALSYGNQRANEAVADQVAGAKRRWRVQFRGSRRDSAGVVQLSTKAATLLLDGFLNINLKLKSSNFRAAANFKDWPLNYYAPKNESN